MTERRKSMRRALHLPVAVKGHLRDGTPWDESSTTSDVANGGVCVLLRHAVVLGEVLHLSLPLPEIFRRYDTTSPSYRVYGLVRNVSEGTPHRVGVMFLGRHPPRGHEQNPGGLFFLPSDPQPAWSVQRAHPRYDLLVTVRLKRLDESLDEPAEELTITEDVSLGGARVRTSLPVSKGELVRLEEMGGPFRASAVVQNAALGSDKVRRLNLQFMDEDEAQRVVKDLLRRHGLGG